MSSAKPAMRSSWVTMRSTGTWAASGSASGCTAGATASRAASAGVGRGEQEIGADGQQHAADRVARADARTVAKQQPREGQRRQGRMW
jgi:hypothetical protein